MNKDTYLPKKFKKQIVDFTKTYQELAKPRKIIISLTKKFTVSVTWDSDDTLSIFEENWPDCSNSKEIQLENKKIKKFIEETVDFGKKYFNDKDWLWTTILWNFRPECNEKFDFKRVVWLNQKDWKEHE